MTRYRCHLFDDDGVARYVVVWSLDWRMIECRRAESGCDFHAALMQAIARAEQDGWQAEGSPDFGFLFMRRGHERRLLMLTRRDPGDPTRQSFNPFRPTS